MTKSGTIKLIARTENREWVVASLLYKSTKQRQAIIEDWLKLYESQLPQYYFQIVPDILGEHKPVKMIPDAPKPVIVRPPSTYSNPQYKY